MHALRPKRSSLHPLWLAVLGFLVLSCAKQTVTPERNEPASKIAGTWILQARINDAGESPARHRLMRLVLNPDGTFVTNYRGDESQGWIRSGQGGFSYEPPYLNLFWENGASVTLLVTELEPDRILVHHGRNHVPLKDQEPQEIFVRQKMERGPTRISS